MPGSPREKRKPPLSASQLVSGTADFPRDVAYPLAGNVLGKHVSKAPVEMGRDDGQGARGQQEIVPKEVLLLSGTSVPSIVHRKEPRKTKHPAPDQGPHSPPTSVATADLERLRPGWAGPIA